MSQDTSTVPVRKVDALPEIVRPLPPDRHPAATYLASLAPGSRPSVRSGLRLLATLLSGGRTNDWSAIDWSAVRFQHAAAIRTLLAERFAPSTANRQLAVLRGVLRQAWLLGAMSAEDYHRACATGAVKGTRLPAGRALSSGELRSLFSSSQRAPRTR